MGASDFYKSDLLRSKKPAGFDGVLEKIDIKNQETRSCICFNVSCSLVLFIQIKNCLYDSLGGIKGLADLCG